MAVRDDVAQTIAGFALFADLTSPQLEEIVHSFDEAWFGEGERILRQGVSGSNFYVILDGVASVRVGGVERRTLTTGDFFGEISCLLGDVPVADIVAARPLRCLVLPCPQLESFLSGHPRLLFRLLQAEARKLKLATSWLS
jgi:CRP-like cAMP-binding protein